MRYNIKEVKLHYRQNEVWQVFWSRYKQVNMKHMKSNQEDNNFKIKTLAARES